MTEPPVLTVSELTVHIKEFLETAFPYVWVRGEISNCTRAGSGHFYLTLKDDSAQIRAIVWRTTASKLKFQLEDGLEVVAAGPVELYEARGTYQLIIQELWPQGLGALELAFRQLHEKLAKEGLFAPERKRPLPRFPRRIALITSPSGAAVRDMLQVITRRWRGADLILLPVAVQGAGAAEEIAAALSVVHRIPDVDVVITGRGGGSLEDLWAFNEEIVARAIAACPIPVISAVGHEIDLSISDLVADRRALTPSEAGELVVPHADEIRSELNQLQSRLVSSLKNLSQTARWQLNHLAERRALSRPFEMLHDRARTVDELEARLQRGMQRVLDNSRAQLGGVSGALHALSPLNVLERGYSLTQILPEKSSRKILLRDSAQAQPGMLLETRLHSGTVTSRVESTTHSPSTSNDTTHE
ncbi:MAG: exodeoxyribonuclease VII large subunit [Planctomycetales bacterium]